MTFIAVIATVLNEGESIRGLMDSLVTQTRQPDSVVITDGGSSDHTVTVMREYADRLPLTILVSSGANISAGRNQAITAVTSAETDPIIVSTDAGVVLDPEWLARLVQPLLNDLSLNVSAGFFQADPRTIFEAALGATTLPSAEEIDPATFLPSSRSVAFRKSAWERVGGYPEWLDYCEDLIFDLRLKALTGSFAFVPDAIAHFRPRPTLKSFYKQYYRYARGDGKADLWRKRHAIRYATYFVALPAGILLGALVHPALWLLLLVGGAVYMRTPYRRLPDTLSQLQFASNTPSPRDPLSLGAVRGRGGWGVRSYLHAAALLPIIRVVGDVAKMVGYPVGWCWRLKNNPPDWKPR